MQKRNAALITAAFATGGVFTASTNASVIVQDSLTNQAESGNLNGSHADTTPGASGATWTSITSTTAYTRTSSGTLIGAGSSPPVGASFPVSISSGSIYTLQTTISIATGGTGTGGNWVTLQFNHTDSSSLTQGAISGHAEYEPWMFVRTNDNGAQHIGDGGIGGGSTGASTYSSSSLEDQNLYTLSIVLDTTTTYWGAKFYENGTQVGTYNYSASIPNPSGANDIEAVSIGAYSDAAAMASNFSLTQTPEPASLGLIAMGSLGLLARRRRRTAGGAATVPGLDAALIPPPTREAAAALRR